MKIHKFKEINDIVYITYVILLKTNFDIGIGRKERKSPICSGSANELIYITLAYLHYVTSSHLLISSTVEKDTEKR